MGVIPLVIKLFNTMTLCIFSLGDSDYADVNQTLLFTPGGEMTLCFDVLINDDIIYERSEVFSLSLNPLESAHIQLTNSTVLVEILDDEGTDKSIPYIRKYWRALNLAVESKIAIARILADLSLAVQYGITIHILYVSRKFWRIFNLAVVNIDCQTAKFSGYLVIAVSHYFIATVEPPL